MFSSLRPVLADTWSRKILNGFSSISDFFKPFENTTPIQGSVLVGFLSHIKGLFKGFSNFKTKRDGCTLLHHMD